MPVVCIQICAKRITRTEAERLVDMSLGFLGTAEKILCDPDIRVSASQISI